LLTRNENADEPEGLIASVEVPLPGDCTPPLTATDPVGHRTAALLLAFEPSLTTRTTVEALWSCGVAEGTTINAAAVSAISHLPMPQSLFTYRNPVWS
jgi:hypothetical protein